MRSLVCAVLLCVSVCGVACGDDASSEDGGPVQTSPGTSGTSGGGGTTGGGATSGETTATTSGATTGHGETMADAGGDDVDEGDVSRDDVADDVIEDVAEDVSEDVTEDVALDVSDDVTEDVIEDVPEDVPDDVIEDVAEDVTEDAPTDADEPDVEDTPDTSEPDAADDTDTGDFDDAGGLVEVCPDPPGGLPEVNAERNGRMIRWSGVEGDGVLSARDVTIYLPAAYDEQPDRRFPVLYMHDGQNLFDASQAAFGVEWGVDETIDRLTNEGHIDPWIVVGVHNTPDRVNDYTVEVDPGREAGGNGARYAAWLNDRLKPLVDSELRTLCGTHNTAVAGSSLGGLISFEIGQRHPETFGRIGSLSPSFWWNEGATMVRFEEGGILPERLWIDSGTEEGGYLLTQTDTPTTGEQDLSSVARHARRVLRHALTLGATYGDDVAYREEYRGLHNEAAWAYRLGTVLTYLLAERTEGLQPASMEAFTTRTALRTGESVAVRIEAELEGGAGRITWPLEALEVASEPSGALSVDALGHVRADVAGVSTAMFSYGDVSASLTLDVVEAQGSASVLFVVSPPFPAPMNVHIAGSPSIFGEWDPSGVRMHPMSDGRWMLRVPLGSGDAFEYKYNLSGTWDFVEKGSNGEEVGNRAGLVSSGVLFEDFVLRWAGF